ncbi:ribose ABC transporter permease [Sneathiella chungangensis]|uniref:Ribose ABC transporter permease n=1 Tax=Sneathiella chungangensis TaxID=1418234 RepID=A0A845MJY6_9PROT|nr:ABC transporter permease [Sneathiella chungangensis]MZR23922.1 ribose ABC transporter permease [Sneathiella chungangensis]
MSTIAPQAASFSSRIPFEPAVFGPVAILLIMFAGYSIASPHFLTVENITNVLVQSAPLIILAVGQTFVLLIGGLDLSQGSIVSVVSVVTASTMMAFGIEIGAFVGIGSGILIGVANGLLVGWARIQSFIVTLGMLYMAAGLAMVISDGSSIFGLPRPDVDLFFWFGGGRLGPIPVPLLIAVLTVGIAHYVLQYRPLGRYIYAVGSNERVAHVSGIKVERIKMTVFIFSGSLAAMGGFLLSGRVISGQPLLGAGDLLLQSIGAVIIGGTSIFGGSGGVLRSLLGVLVIAFMINGLNLLAISTFTQQVIVGAIIVASAWLNAIHRRN